MENRSINGALYFMLLVDDFSRKVFVYFLRHKHETFGRFAEFKTMVENQTGRKIKTLRTDNGKEYCNNDFKDFCRQNGIVHQTSNVHTPEQNGLVERMNRTVVERAKCMLYQAKLEVKFWAEAVNTAVYLVNRSIASGLKNQTPYEAWSEKKPNLGHLRIFGCKAMMHVPKAMRTKWQPKSKEMVFVGYGESTKGYRLIDRVKMKLQHSRDVIFMESDDDISTALLETSNAQHNRVTQSVGTNTEAANDSVRANEPYDADSTSDDVEFVDCDDDIDRNLPETNSKNVNNSVEDPLQVRRSTRAQKQRTFEGVVSHMCGINVG